MGSRATLTLFAPVVVAAGLCGGCGDAEAAGPVQPAGLEVPEKEVPDRGAPPAQRLESAQAVQHARASDATPAAKPAVLQTFTWTPDAQPAIDGTALSVMSSVSRIQYTSFFDGDRRFKIYGQTATGHVNSVQTLDMAGVTGPTVDQQVETFSGVSSSWLDGELTEEDAPFGSNLPGTDLVHRLASLPMQGSTTTVDGTDIAEVEFVGAFPFYDAWLPPTGRATSLHDEWDRQLGPIEVGHFLRHPIRNATGQLSGLVENFFVDDGDQIATISLQGLLSFERISRNGTQHDPTHALLTGTVDYNISQGFTVRGSFRVLEPIAAYGGPSTPGLSISGYTDWRTTFRTF